MSKLDELNEFLDELGIKNFTIDDYNHEKKILEEEFFKLGIKPEEINSKLEELGCNSKLVENWIALQTFSPYLNKEI